jgi:CRISPR-associated protein Csb1
MSAEGVRLVEQYDGWLKDESDVAALVMRQCLEPVEGKDGVIFPPTYAKPEYLREEEWTGYNLDRLGDGSLVCQIDSVGAQANRMEPIFKRPRYRHLVPQIVVKVSGRDVNLLDAGHRAADAIVRFSTLWKELEEAFNAARDGNAAKLAKLAPTSLVFGAWDSRGTQVKLPRIVRSVIRAFKVDPLHRSAQYIPAVEYVGERLLEAPRTKQEQDSMSQLGLSHAPAPWSHGGILVREEIRRDATLNLVALRALGSDTNSDPLPLRRYIFGLSLVVFTAPQDSFLREGCQLVPDPNRPAQWSVVHHDGHRDDEFNVPHKDALEFATTAAEAFGVDGREIREVNFDAEAAKKALGQSKEERKKARRADKEETKEVAK